MSWLSSVWDGVKNLGKSVASEASDLLGGGVVGDLIQGGVDLYDTYENNKTKKEINKQNWDNTLDLWNKQNAYNAPSAQRQRLEAAGLNPALAYGGSGAGGVAASVSAPALQTPVSDHHSLGQVAGHMAEHLLAIKQMNYQNQIVHAQAIQAQNQADISSAVKHSVIDNTINHNTLDSQMLKSSSNFMNNHPDLGSALSVGERFLGSINSAAGMIRDSVGGVASLGRKK